MCKNKKKLFNSFKRIFPLTKEQEIPNMRLGYSDGWDSLSHIKVINLIEKEYKLKINQKNFDKLKSFKSILKLIF